MLHSATYYHHSNIQCTAMPPPPPPSPQAQPQLQLNTDVIHSVKRGVEFGRLLQLPDEVAFTSQHMADVLIVTGTAKPLKLIRCGGGVGVAAPTVYMQFIGACIYIYSGTSIKGNSE